MHDPSLNRTTTGNGMISDRNYFGDIEFLTTKEEPHCPIARFQDVLDLLFKTENSHIWAVIDVKVVNSPKILITLGEIFKSRNENLSVFSKRFALGIWHPKFMSYANTYLPGIPIVHIGISLGIARNYFSNVDGYNMFYLALSLEDGRKFIEEAHAKGKPVFAWTVNKESRAKNCHNLNVDAIMTDRTKFYADFFKSLKDKSSSIERKKFQEVGQPSWFISLLNFTCNKLLYLMGKWRLFKYGNSGNSTNF